MQRCAESTVTEGADAPVGKKDQPYAAMQIRSPADRAVGRQNEDTIHRGQIPLKVTIPAQEHRPVTPSASALVRLGVSFTQQA